MKEVVYILGSGLNQVVKDWHNDSPPMLNNFFNLVVKKRKNLIESKFNPFKHIFNYIETTLDKNISQLASEPFDLEKCFTKLDDDIKSAKNEKNKENLLKLYNIRSELTSILTSILSEFEYFAVESSSMINFGKVILNEDPTIIAFNYDCLLEHVLELTSRVKPNDPRDRIQSRPTIENGLSDSELTYSHFNWNLPLAYGFKFDEIQIQRAGYPKFADGKRFYSLTDNVLYKKPFLKLHGSLNWCKYVNERANHSFPGEPVPSFGDNASKIILRNEHWSQVNRLPNHNGWMISPVIITPVMYKDEYYNSRPFKELWEMAEISISKCSKLVIIGYSFPLTDHSTQNLLEKGLSDNDLEELVVINPDEDIVEIAKKLCHFGGKVKWHKNLDEYLGSC
jgi:hypothetical protein